MDEHFREIKAAKFPWNRFFGRVAYLLLFPAGLLYTYMILPVYRRAAHGRQSHSYQALDPTGTAKYEMRPSLSIYFIFNWCMAAGFALLSQCEFADDAVLQWAPAVVYACTAVLRASISAAGIQLTSVEHDLQRRKLKVARGVFGRTATASAKARQQLGRAEEVGSFADEVFDPAAIVRTSELLDQRARWIIEYAASAGVKLRELDGEEERGCARFFAGETNARATKRLHTVNGAGEILLLGALACGVPAYLCNRALASVFEFTAGGSAGALDECLASAPLYSNGDRGRWMLTALYVGAGVSMTAMLFYMLYQMAKVRKKYRHLRVVATIFSRITSERELYKWAMKHPLQQVQEDQLKQHGRLSFHTGEEGGHVAPLIRVGGTIADGELPDSASKSVAREFARSLHISIHSSPSDVREWYALRHVLKHEYPKILGIAGLEKFLAVVASVVVFIAISLSVPALLGGGGGGGGEGTTHGDVLMLLVMLVFGAQVP
jgi:hypothetical protein